MHKRPFSAISSRDPYIRGVISPISSAQRGSWLKYPRYARNGTRRGGQPGTRSARRGANGQPGAHGGRPAGNTQRTAGQKRAENSQRRTPAPRGARVPHRTMAAASHHGGIQMEYSLLCRSANPFTCGLTRTPSRYPICRAILNISSGLSSCRRVTTITL